MLIVWEIEYPIMKVILRVNKNMEEIMNKDQKALDEITPEELAKLLDKLDEPTEWR
jgi:hypothetical protein